MGQFIRGLFGGESRNGQKAYAGITLVSFKDEGDKVEFKLHNMSRSLKAPKDIIEKYSINVYYLNLCWRNLPILRSPPLSSLVV